MRLWAGVGLLLILAGCASSATDDALAKPRNALSTGDFPYHPLIYHLDLSILAYQLYSQTLVWPFDPYYEELAGSSNSRTQFMTKVRAWAEGKGADQKRGATGPGGYRGPGVLGGFENNPGHDPILYDYSRLHPWSHSIVNAEGRWTEYMTPAQITGQIRDVYVCYRRSGGPDRGMALDKIVPGREDHAPDAGDVLLAFEGGTGDKGESGQPASQSLMGFVLLRTKPSGVYDVHISFRGSRSGSAARAFRQALSTRNATGNPDWITDMGTRRLEADRATDISTTGSVSRGFAQCLNSLHPQVFHCLSKIAEIRGGLSPENIYVTGHSLGGALAQHFVSAVLLGNRYGPGGAGEDMPATLRAWPWRQIKLITFGAPRAGDAQWARTLTASGLDSEFYSPGFDTTDPAALAVTDSGIVSRLLDPHRSVGYRVLISRDPITAGKPGSGAQHVGKTVYVNKTGAWDWLRSPDFSAHEPANIRRYMVDALADSLTPSIAWRYRLITDLNPDRNAEERGSVEELTKLAAAIKRYYSDNGFWFDATAFERDLELRFAIERGD